MRIRPPHAGTVTTYLTRLGLSKAATAGHGFVTENTTTERSGQPGGVLTVCWISATAATTGAPDSETDTMLASLRVALVWHGYAVRRVAVRDLATGVAVPALLLIEAEHATDADRRAPDAPVTLADTDRDGTLYDAHLQRVLGKEWEVTATGLSGARVAAFVATARQDGALVFPLPDGTVRIGLAAYRPVRRISVVPDADGVFAAPGGWDSWWVHEVSDDGGTTWQLLDSGFLLRAGAASKAAASAHGQGHPMVYDPVSRTMTGIAGPVPTLTDRLTRLADYLGAKADGSAWELETDGEAGQVLRHADALDLLGRAYADRLAWAKLTDGALRFSWGNGATTVLSRLA